MMGHRGCRLAVTYPEIASYADQSCYPCSNQREKGSSGLEHGTRDHDPVIGEVKELKYARRPLLRLQMQRSQQQVLT